ncbi:MAG: fumarate reductase subunit FrdD [Gammaproteobacteria bacterium]|nr:fumarate reductase subunit FrdD [Gammaproteobacteria bacterium]
MQRSNAPVFWLLFGAGGMLSALVGPILVFITGIAVPLGLLLPADTLSYPHVLTFVRSWIGGLFLFAVVMLFLWHAGHRIFHSLHDLGIRTGIGAKLFCYGVPLVATLATVYMLVFIRLS